MLASGVISCDLVSGVCVEAFLERSRWPKKQRQMSTNKRRRLGFALLFGGGALLIVGGSGGAWFALQDQTTGELFQLEAKAPRHQWKSIDKKHWQAISGDDEEPSITDAREGTRGSCPAGMVEVSGKYKLDSHGRESSGEVEELQNSSCVDWISRDFPARCKTFDRAGWLELSQKLPSKPMRFCIDRFEYPNRKGQNPMIVVSYNEATALCKAGGKRLCNESEWTYACEGDEARPYPYGYDRDRDACVVDRNWKPFTENGLAPRDGKKARDELDRLWQGMPSGSNPRCKSASGVYDLTGNVDEWTRTVRTTGYASVLKGGYWGPIRARCRPSTRAHNEDFVAYQQSFRCCSAVAAGSPDLKPQDPPGASPAPSASAAPSAAPTPSAAPAPGDVRRLDDEMTHVVPDPEDDSDELEQLAKHRGVHCGFAPGRAASGVLASALLAAVALLAARRRQR